jgi:hypothetical protein
MRKVDDTNIMMYFPSKTDLNISDPDVVIVLYRLDVTAVISLQETEGIARWQWEIPFWRIST